MKALLASLFFSDNSDGTDSDESSDTFEDSKEDLCEEDDICNSQISSDALPSNSMKRGATSPALAVETKKSCTDIKKKVK